MENRPPTPPYSPAPIPMSESDSRMWAMLVHLSTFTGLITGIGFLIAPIIIWQIQKDKSAFIDYHGKEAVNFQITIAIASAISFLLTFIVIGAFLLIIVGIVWLVFSIIAAIKANNGEYYRYPLTIRFIK